MNFNLIVVSFIDAVQNRCGSSCDEKKEVTSIHKRTREGDSVCVCVCVFNQNETTNNKQTIDKNTMVFRDLVVDVVREFFPLLFSTLSW